MVNCRLPFLASGRRGPGRSPGRFFLAHFNEILKQILRTTRPTYSLALACVPMSPLDLPLALVSPLLRGDRACSHVAVDPCAMGDITSPSQYYMTKQPLWCVESGSMWLWKDLVLYEINKKNLFFCGVAVTRSLDAIVAAWTQAVGCTAPPSPGPPPG